MIPEIIRYRIPAAQVEEFEAAYRQAGLVLQQSEHCLGYELMRSAKDHELYLLTIRWKSASAHMDGFRKSAQFGRFFALVKPYVSNILEMEHYDNTGLIWRRED